MRNVFGKERISKLFMVMSFFFVSVPVFSQISYEWKTRRTSTGKEDFLVYLKVDRTDLGVSGNNVHQVLFTFNPHCPQGSDLNFLIRMPNSSYDDYFLQDFGTSPTFPVTYTSSYNNGYQVVLDKVSGLDQYTIEVRFLPISGNPNGYGVVGVGIHTQNTVDFYIQIKNATLPDPAVSEFMSKVDNLQQFFLCQLVQFLAIYLDIHSLLEK